MSPKLIVMVGMAMLFAQLQCAAACTSQFSHNVPPCHRHHQSPCHEDVSTGAAANHALFVPALSVAFASQSAPPVRPAANSACCRIDPSPPDIAPSAPLILRI